MIRRLLKIFAAVALVLTVLFIARLAFFAVDSHMNKPPKGSAAAGLRPCPDKPNCVSSRAERPDQRVDPLPAPAGADAATALEHARRVIDGMPGGRVTEVSAGYLHAEFTSRIFKFRDDLELIYEAERQILDVRSASRVGYSDLGANRKRVEELRRRLADALP